MRLIKYYRYFRNLKHGTIESFLLARFQISVDTMLFDIHAEANHLGLDLDPLQLEYGRLIRQIEQTKRVKLSVPAEGRPLASVITFPTPRK